MTILPLTLVIHTPTSTELPMRCTIQTLTYLCHTRAIDAWDALELWSRCSDFERAIIRRMSGV